MHLYELSRLPYYAYNNYAHAMRLIDSFFFTLLPSPSSRSIHRSCRPNNAPPRVSICAFRTVVCTDGLRVRACVRVYRRETRFRREKQHHKTEEQRIRRGRRTVFLCLFSLSSSPPPSLSLFLQYVYA